MSEQLKKATGAPTTIVKAESPGGESGFPRHDRFQHRGFTTTSHVRGFHHLLDTLRSNMEVTRGVEVPSATPTGERKA